MNHAHPAFPPAPIPASPAAPSAAPSTHDPRAAPLPSAADLAALLTTRDPHRIRDVVVPELARVLAGQPRGAGGKRERGAGEELVALPKVEIGEDDVRERSAAMVFVLSARMKLAKGKTPALLELARLLCIEGDAAQMALCSSRLADLAWSIIKVARELDQMDAALDALATLIQRVIHPTAFSGVYAAFLEACLLAQNYVAGLPALDLVFADAATFKPTYLDVLTYHHHGGLILAYSGDYARAVQFFTFAVAMPTTSISAVQLACAKRAILCELLHSGTHLRLPKWTPHHVSQTLDRATTEYDELARAFERRDWDVVAEKAGAGVFDKDCNRGLVDRIVGSVLKRRILKLREIYSHLTLAVLTEKCRLSGPEGEAGVARAVEDMIKSNEIPATITGNPAVVTFLDGDDLARLRPQLVARLQQQRALAELIEQQLVQSDRTLGLETPWLEKQMHRMGAGGGASRLKGEDSDVVMGELAGGLRGPGGNLADVGF